MNPCLLFTLFLFACFLSLDSSLPDTTSIRATTARCQVCNELRNYGKYRRHLNMHVRNGDINSEQVSRILFQTKYTRKDKKNKTCYIKTGHKCEICGTHVLQLQVHLRNIHGLDSADNQHTSANSDEITRRDHFFAVNQVNCNPLHEYSKKSKLNCNLVSKIVFKDLSSTISGLKPLPNDSRKDVFDFSSESEINDDDILTNPNDILNINNHRNISKVFLDSILDFKDFLSTSLGGCEPPKTITMDISNLCLLINNLGENSIWKPHSLNSYLEKESKCKAPITVHSRIRSSSRYIKFLQSSDSKLLPDSQQLTLLSTMIDRMEKSLLRKRKSRQKLVMSKNRRNFAHTCSTLTEWRKKRLNCNALGLLEDFKTNSKSLESFSMYRKIRDFLICEILIANGQRSGIISGMEINEVNSAQGRLSSRYNIIVVANHKTGSTQPATIFVPSNIFTALTVFIHCVLPKLPVYLSRSKTLDDYCPVFQTFTGSLINSSLVSPIVRRGLLDLDILYSGSVTDFRRAAATLTGEQNPALSETMAQLMCHSRTAHDRYYRIQNGNSNLLSAFLQLERMQTTPFSANINQNSSSPISPLCNYSSSINCGTLIHPCSGSLMDNTPGDYDGNDESFIDHLVDNSFSNTSYEFNLHNYTESQINNTIDIVPEISLSNDESINLHHSPRTLHNNNSLGDNCHIYIDDSQVTLDFINLSIDEENPNVHHSPRTLHNRNSSEDNSHISIDDSQVTLDFINLSLDVENTNVYHSPNSLYICTSSEDGCHISLNDNHSPLNGKHISLNEEDSNLSHSPTDLHINFADVNGHNDNIITLDEVNTNVSHSLSLPNKTTFSGDAIHLYHSQNNLRNESFHLKKKMHLKDCRIVLKAINIETLNSETGKCPVIARNDNQNGYDSDDSLSTMFQDIATYSDDRFSNNTEDVS